MTAQVIDLAEVRRKREAERAAAREAASTIAGGFTDDRAWQPRYWRHGKLYVKRGEHFVCEG